MSFRVSGALAGRRQKRAEAAGRSSLPPTPPNGVNIRRVSDLSVHRVQGLGLQV